MLGKRTKQALVAQGIEHRFPKTLQGSTHAEVLLHGPSLGQLIAGCRTVAGWFTDSQFAAAYLASTLSSCDGVKQHGLSWHVGVGGSGGVPSGQLIYGGERLPVNTRAKALSTPNTECVVDLGRSL
jgi:hypothetical protein